MSTLELMDPKSGRRVFVGAAQLTQGCHFCGQQLLGEVMAQMEGGPGWVCVRHLERLLLSAKPTLGTQARTKARKQLKDAQPGDVTTVTHTLLAALAAH